MGAIPIGLGARDTLRLEKGYLLSGQILMVRKRLLNPVTHG